MNITHLNFSDIFFITSYLIIQQNEIQSPYVDTVFVS